MVNTVSRHRRRPSSRRPSVAQRIFSQVLEEVLADPRAAGQNAFSAASAAADAASRAASAAMDWAQSSSASAAPPDFKFQPSRETSASGRPVPRSRGLGATLHYKPPPRTILAKNRWAMSKQDLHKLNRYNTKYPIPASVKVILGNQIPPSGADQPLGPQWTRTVISNLPTGADAPINCAAFVVALTRNHGTAVGQHNISASSASADSDGHFTAANLLWSTNPSNDNMLGLAHNYSCSGVRAQTDSDYLVSGFKGSFTIGGMQQACDQQVYCQIVRRFDAPSSTAFIPSSDFKELVNGQMLPNDQHWSLLWKQTFIIQGRAPGSAKIPTKKVSFDIPLNYIRSKCKKVSTAASSSYYGTQLEYAFKDTEEMYNECYLVISTRALNLMSQRPTDVTAAAAGGATQTVPVVTPGTVYMVPKIGIQGHVTTHYRFRNKAQT